ELWFRGGGWGPLGPTPGRGGVAGSYSASSPSFDVGAATAVLAGKGGFKGVGHTLANTLGFRTPARTSRAVPQLGAAPVGVVSTSHPRRDLGILRLLAL